MLCQLFDTVKAIPIKCFVSYRPTYPFFWKSKKKKIPGYKRAVLGTTILANGKAHFGPADRNDQTCHCRPPSKLVPNSLNILVVPNRNGPFHLINQPKFPEFWVECKAPLKTTSTNGFNFRIINSFMISCGVRLTWLDVGCSRMS